MDCDIEDMRVSVQVKPNSRKESVEAQPDGTYVVRAHAPPIEGRANERVRELLAAFFKRPLSAVALVAGQRGKKKIFEIS